METSIFNKPLFLITLLTIGFIFVLSPVESKTLASEKPSVISNYVGSGDEKFDRIFREGRELMDKEEWAKAAAKFNEIVCDCPENKYVDAAFYWLAYCYKKQKMYKETNATIERMLKNFPNSSWAEDARIMRYQVIVPGEAIASTAIRQGNVRSTAVRLTPPSVISLAGTVLSTGQLAPLDREDEIKLAAFQTLISADPKKGIEAMGNLLRQDAKASETLKREVIRSLRGPRFFSSQNSDVWEYTIPHSVLNKEFATLLKETLLKGFQSETNVKVRTEILYTFANINDEDSANYLMQLYSSESDKEIKKAIINSFSISSYSIYNAYVPYTISSGSGSASSDGQVVEATASIKKTTPTASSPSASSRSAAIKLYSDKLMEIVRTEKDLELKRLAFANLQRFVGWSAKEGIADTLIQMYDAESDEQFKITLIKSFSGQKNAQLTNKLLNIARNDKSNKLRLEAIFALRNNKDPEVIKFLEELIK